AAARRARHRPRRPRRRRRGLRRDGPRRGAAHRAHTLMAERLLSRPYVLVCLTTALAAHAPNLLTLLPRHLRAMELAERAIGVVMGAMPLASILTMPVVARSSDAAGRRAPVLFGLVLCALACAAFERCTSFPAFLAARVVCGVGWAFVLVGGS